MVGLTLVRTFGLDVERRDRFVRVEDRVDRRERRGTQMHERQQDTCYAARTFLRVESHALRIQRLQRSEGMPIGDVQRQEGQPPTRTKRRGSPTDHTVASFLGSAGSKD